MITLRRANVGDHGSPNCDEVYKVGGVVSGSKHAPWMWCSAVRTVDEATPKKVIFSAI